MKWILLITIFGADAEPLKISYSYPTEEICLKAGSYFMADYNTADSETAATFTCKPASPFVTPNK